MVCSLVASVRSFLLCCVVFFFSSRRRHTRCALVTGVQTCALPILSGAEKPATLPLTPHCTKPLALTASKVAPAKAGPVSSATASPPHEIGRASCRERVCQYV